jgi:CDP-diacylglycerol---serine O-phosphatidyltransferase
VLTLANGITSASLVVGFLALLAAVEGHLGQAAALVALAGILDLLDGAAARRHGGDREFGTNLDSLVDIVSFGVVPAMALYVGPLRTLPVLGLAGCLCFLVAGAWRLARFPLVKRSDHFVGVPIPVAGVLLMFFLLWEPAAGLTLAVVLVASVLMLSTIPFPTLPAASRGATALLHGPDRRPFPRAGAERLGGPPRRRARKTLSAVRRRARRPS